MKFKKDFHKLRVASVLALLLSTGMCAGFFTMPAMASAARPSVKAAMASCQETASHQHGFYKGPLLSADHRAAGPADCCINHARSYQTIVRTSDSQRHQWTAAVVPSTVTVTLVIYSPQHQYTSEIFPPPEQAALASVIKLE